MNRKAEVEIHALSKRVMLAHTTHNFIEVLFEIYIL